MNSDNRASNFSREDMKTWDRAVFLSSEGNYAHALPLFQALWEKGYPETARRIARIEERLAKLDHRSFSKAEHWYEQALREERSNASKFNLGRIIIMRFRLESNEISGERFNYGISLLSELADRNVIEAALFLARLYEEGKLVPQDLRIAKKLAERGVAAGFVMGYSLLRRIEWRNRHFIHCILLTFTGLINGIKLLFGKADDRRLFGVPPLSPTDKPSREQWRL